MMCVGLIAMRLVDVGRVIQVSDDQRWKEGKGVCDFSAFFFAFVFGRNGRPPPR